jgi:YVTN family beta-propeller protein
MIATATGATATSRTSRLAIVGLAAAFVMGLVLLASITSRASAAPTGQGTLWLTNRNAAGDVTAYDAATGELLGLVAVGQVPIGIVVDPRTQRVYVTNEGAGSNSVSVIDPRTMSVTATIPTGTRPHHMQISSNGRCLYFGAFGTNKVGVINTDTNDYWEYATTAPGNTTARTHSVRPSRDGKYLYAANSDVANTATNGSVVKLDAATGSILWTLPIGNQPSEVTLSPNGKLGYVSVRGENAVKVVDLEVPAVIATVSVGTQPDTVLLTPDGKLLTVALRGSPAQMTIVDTSTLAATIVTLTGSLAGHHDVSMDGRFSYVAVEGGAGQPPGIAVVDNLAAAQVGFILHPLTGAKPHGLWLEARNRS